jgi:hypothetical protein
VVGGGVCGGGRQCLQRWSAASTAVVIGGRRPVLSGGGRSTENGREEMERKRERGRGSGGGGAGPCGGRPCGANPAGLSREARFELLYSAWLRRLFGTRWA